MPSAPAESDRQQLMQAAHGFRISQALYVVAKLGIADLLEDGPKTSDELAKRADAHPRALFRVLRVLASLGYFTQDASNRFGLTPKTRPLLTDDPDSVRPMIVFLGEGQYRATGELLHTVRTGETSFDHLHGMGHFEYLAQNPEASAVFNAAMASGSVRRRIHWTGTTSPAGISWWTSAEAGGIRSCRSCGRVRR